MSNQPLSPTEQRLQDYGGSGFIILLFFATWVFSTCMDNVGPYMPLGAYFLDMILTSVFTGK